MHSGEAAAANLREIRVFVSDPTTMDHEAAPGSFRFGRYQYRQQRRQDGVFALDTYIRTLTTLEIAQSK